MSFSVPSNAPVAFGSDPFLRPYMKHIAARRERVQALERRLTGGTQTLAEFASGHEYFGLHRKKDGNWVFREWAPNASGIVLVGDFSAWKEQSAFRLASIGSGVWELELPASRLRHGMHYAMSVKWPGGGGLRLPAYVRKVVQDERTKLFAAQVWEPEPYVFRNASPPRPEGALVYEAHVGMAQEEPKVGTFSEFREKILPRVAQSGYNTLQLMGIMNHPYYGSFGYHVSNFFAVSDRFGSPEEFKALVDAAHGFGLRVVIDLVHSHAVRNEAEGLGRIDGTRHAYFHDGGRGVHPAWDSYCFDYAKPEVLHFLLSNCRFYLDEYQLDGFRFDGVTSMLYFDHGLGQSFNGYENYFGPGVDEDALAYLTLANRVIHDVRPDAVSIAEEVSGMPGLAAPAKEGGVGFDFRLAMGVSDLWFKLLDRRDEEWNPGELFHELVNRRNDERTIGYVECHDQALVGGKTAIFTMADRHMYDGMHRGSGMPEIDRAVALHKLMRLATAAAAGNGYLNFMGNEFGHPEWIDFPRRENHWSFSHARRQWSLLADDSLRFGALARFDRAMLDIVGAPGFFKAAVQCVRVDEAAKILIFERNGKWFLFNFHPTASRSDYRFEVPGGEYVLRLDSDAPGFDGFGRVAQDQRYQARHSFSGDFLSVYLPCRTALVLEKS